MSFRSVAFGCMSLSRNPRFLRRRYVVIECCVAAREQIPLMRGKYLE